MVDFILRITYIAYVRRRTVLVRHSRPEALYASIVGSTGRASAIYKVRRCLSNL